MRMQCPHKYASEHTAAPAHRPYARAPSATSKIAVEVLGISRKNSNNPVDKDSARKHGLHPLEIALPHYHLATHSGGRRIALVDITDSSIARRWRYLKYLLLR